MIWTTSGARPPSRIRRVAAVRFTWYFVVSDVLNTHEAGETRKQLPLDVADAAAARRYELTTVCRAGS